MTLKEAFQDRVYQAIDTHWYWELYVNPDGYGRCSLRKKNGEFAHRVAWELEHGPIPRGMTIDHLCRIRSCQNPAHMEVVTPEENVRRGSARKTHCPQGHEYSGVDNRGWRICKLCMEEAGRRYRR